MVLRDRRASRVHRGRRARRVLQVLLDRSEVLALKAYLDFRGPKVPVELSVILVQPVQLVLSVLSGHVEELVQLGTKV